MLSFYVRVSRGLREDIQKLGLFNFSKQYIDFFSISVPNSLQ